MDAIIELGELSLGSRLKRLTERTMKVIQSVYQHEKIDFDPYLFPAFHDIAIRGPLTNTDLCESLQTSQPAVTQTINKLNAKGLITLTEDSDDKRKKQIKLSPKGEVYLNRMQPVWEIMDSTVKQFTPRMEGTLLDHIGLYEKAIVSGEFENTLLDHLAELERIEIIDFEPNYAKQFYDLNIEWLETHFYVEDFDREVLSKPQKYILDPGGHIFFARQGDSILGTVALMPHKSGSYELTKMAVHPSARGKKIGQLLMQHCIDFAKAQGESMLLLYSNTILENAIHIYRKFGFKEVPVEPDSPYDRSNIKMELTL